MSARRVSAGSHTPPHCRHPARGWPLGRASVGLTAQVWCGDSHRLTADLTLVFVRDLRPQAWPDAIRTRLAQFTGDPA